MIRTDAAERNRSERDEVRDTEAKPPAHDRRNSMPNRNTPVEEVPSQGRHGTPRRSPDSSNRDVRVRGSYSCVGGLALWARQSREGDAKEEWTEYVVGADKETNDAYYRRQNASAGVRSKTGTSPLVGRCMRDTPTPPQAPYQLKPPPRAQLQYWRLRCGLTSSSFARRATSHAKAPAAVRRVQVRKRTRVEQPHPTRAARAPYTKLVTSKSPIGTAPGT